MPAQGAPAGDPLEPVNRATFQVNRALDTMLVRPLAKTWQTLAPRFVKTGVRNFFGNLGELGNAANNVLQWRLGAATQDLGRFAINSTMGVGGVFEVARPVFGLQRHDQDFGRTLAHWGIEPGPYLVLPVLGPSTVRDALGRGVDGYTDPVSQHPVAAGRDPALALRTVDARARYLPIDEMVFGDEYLYIRELYLQHRQHQVNEGRIDQEIAFEDF